MRWTMWRCYGAMRWGYVTIAPSHRHIVHRIASSSIASPHRPAHRPIASPHRPSHRLIVHRIASSSSRRRNASVSLLGHHRFTICNVESQVFTPNNSRLPRGLNAGGPRPKRVSYHWTTAPLWTTAVLSLGKGCC